MEDQEVRPSVFREKVSKVPDSDGNGVHGPGLAFPPEKGEE